MAAMESAGITVFDLPDNVRGLVFSRWLDPRSLLTLDSACGNKSLRSMLYNEIILPMEWISYQGIMAELFVKWAVRRGVRMRQVRLHGDLTDFALASSFLRTTGACLEDLAVEHCKASISPLCCFASMLCPRLRILELADNVLPLGDGSFQQLLLSCAATLEELHLENTTVVSCTINCTLPKLRLLLLWEKSLNAENFNSLLEKCPNLLTLLYNDTTESHIACPPALATCKKLRNLVYCGIKEGEVTTVRGVLQACPKLEHVELKGSDAAIEQLLPAISDFCVNMRTLSLESETGFTSAAISAIEPRLSGLRHLRIDMLRCEDDQPLLTLAQHCNGLLTLSLRELHGSFSDAALVTLLSSLPALEELDVTAVDELSDEALTALSTHSPHLRQLILTDAAGYSHAGMLALVRGCTALKKVYYTDDEDGEAGGDIVFAQFSRELWRMLRPGITFAETDSEIDVWVNALKKFSECTEGSN
jgi:hypothetical protein